MKTVEEIEKDLLGQVRTHYDSSKLARHVRKMLIEEQIEILTEILHGPSWRTMDKIDELKQELAQ